MACNSVAGESGSINVCSVEPAESGYLVPEDMLFLPAHGVRSESVSAVVGRIWTILGCHSVR